MKKQSKLLSKNEVTVLAVGDSKKGKSINLKNFSLTAKEKCFLFASCF